MTVKAATSSALGVDGVYGTLQDDQGVDVKLQTSQVMQGGASAMHGAAEVVVGEAENVSKIPGGTSLASKGLGILGAPLSFWGFGNDFLQINQENRENGAKISTSFSLVSNAAGAIAGGLLIAAVVAPAAVGAAAVFGAVSLGAAGASAVYNLAQIA